MNTPQAFEPTPFDTVVEDAVPAEAEQLNIPDPQPQMLAQGKPGYKIDPTKIKTLSDVVAILKTLDLTYKEPVKEIEHLYTSADAPPSTDVGTPPQQELIAARLSKQLRSLVQICGLSEKDVLLIMQKQIADALKRL
mgnify:CR=1 FL=1